MISRDPGLRKVIQIAIVCRNVEVTAKRWATLLGVEVPKPVMTDPGNECGMKYRGKASNAQCKLAFFNLGECTLELIEPMGRESSWQDGLDKNGESVHHIGFEVKDFDGTVGAFKEMGMPVIHDGHFQGTNGTYAYIDSQPKLGVMLELLHIKKK